MIIVFFYSNVNDAGLSALNFRRIGVDILTDKQRDPETIWEKEKFSEIIL